MSSSFRIVPKHIKRSAYLALSSLVFFTLAACKESQEAKTVAKRSATSEVKKELVITPSQPFTQHTLADLLTSAKDWDPANDFEEQVAQLSTDGLRALLAELETSKLADPNKRLFGQALAELAKREPAEALAWFDISKQPENRDFWFQVAGALAEESPELLEGWILENLKKGDQKQVSYYTLQGLSSMQHAIGGSRAFEFYTQLPVGTLHANEVMNDVYLYFVKEDWELALKLAREHAAKTNKFGPSDLDYALEIAAFRGKPINTKKRLNLISQIQDPSRQRNALRSHYYRVLRENPEKGIADLKAMKPVDLGNLFKGRVGPFDMPALEAIGEKNPELLYEIVSNIPVSNQEKNTYLDVVGVFALTKPEFAETLISALPDGPMVTEMNTKLYRTIAAEDPTKALESFTTLEDATIRQIALRELGAEATEWTSQEVFANANELAPEDRASFLENPLPRLIRENPKALAATFRKNPSSVPEALHENVHRSLAKNLTLIDPDFAASWFAELPAEAQLQAMPAQAKALVQIDPALLSETLESMPKNEVWAAGVEVLIKDFEGIDPAAANSWKEALSKSNLNGSEN